MSDETLQTIFEGLLAYQVLEGLYFSGGFVFFHSLARDNKMIESNNIINMIKADENQHSEIFGTIIQIFMDDFPQLNTQKNLDYAMNFMRKAVELEKEWSAWIYRDIDTLPVSEYHEYVEYLANLICRNAGMTEPYPENGEIKAKWIVTYGSKKKNNSEIAAKADFLQGNAINYKHEDGGDFDL
jgi:ribonucleoside-diphosphate reductase beta chain